MLTYANQFNPKLLFFLKLITADHGPRSIDGPRVYYIPGIMRLEHACWRGPRDDIVLEKNPLRIRRFVRLSWADKACGSAPTPEDLVPRHDGADVAQNCDGSSGLDDLSGLCVLAHADQLQDQGEGFVWPQS